MWSDFAANIRYGVAPQALMMQDNPANLSAPTILALVYGRPYNYVTFSLDGGISFLPEWCFFVSDGNPYDGADYNTMLQIPGTNTLLLVYANSRSKYSSEILGTYLDVALTKR